MNTKIIIICLLLFGCSTPIKDINQNPTQYVGKTITISGTPNVIYPCDDAVYTFFDSDGNYLYVKTKGQRAFTQAEKTYTITGTISIGRDAFEKPCIKLIET